MNLINHKSRHGIWFYGMSGSGKTFASSISSTVIESSFLVDGDDVRKFISCDLGYSISDRKIQLNRVLGIAQLAINNRTFPIISTVSMTSKILEKCASFGIEVVQIVRPLEQLKEVRTIYQTEQNVVGKDIQIEALACAKLYNYGQDEFIEVITDYVK
jgi:hypothetical protein